MATKRDNSEPGLGDNPNEGADEVDAYVERLHRESASLLDSIVERLTTRTLVANQLSELTGSFIRNAGSYCRSDGIDDREMTKSVQLKGARVVEEVLRMFLAPAGGTLDDGDVRWLMSIREPEMSVAASRAICVELVTQAAERIHSRVEDDVDEPLGFPDEHLALLHALRQVDSAAYHWNPEDVRRKLEQFSASPKGQPGKKGAERICAELMLEGGSSLLGDFEIKVGEREADQAERLRKRLRNDCNRHGRYIVRKAR